MALRLRKETTQLRRETTMTLKRPLHGSPTHVASCCSATNKSSKTMKKSLF
jgi:hypothetical protein